jgi:hypothetical protein
VKEPVSAEDGKGSTAAVEDSLPGSSSSRHAARGFTRAPPLLATERIIGPWVVDTEQGKVPAKSPGSFGTAPIKAQEIPKEIRLRRCELSKFYAKWREENFGGLKKPKGPLDPAVALLPHTQIEYGIVDCEELYSTADEFSCAFTQMASIFLLCANAYPKHAPVCYTLAESCFNMAKISSRLISASWQLCHGFTMSLIRSGLSEIRYPLTDLMGRVCSPLLWYLELYFGLVEDLGTTSFELDEEFQRGYKQPPAKSQISAFASVLDETEAMLKVTMDQIRQLVPAKRAPPHKKKATASSSLDESDDPESEESDRPGQEEISASSSALESKDVKAKSEGDRPEEKEEEVDASNSCDEEDSDDEITESLSGVKARIISYVGDIKVFCKLLRNLKISEC